MDQGDGSGSPDFLLRRPARQLEYTASNGAAAAGGGGSRAATRMPVAQGSGEVPTPRVSSKKKDRPKSFEHKLDKKFGFYAKVKDAAASDPKKKHGVVSLGAKKSISKKKRSRQKKLKAYDLSVLSEFLPDLKPAKVTDVKLNCKSRQKIVQRETAQMRAVLNDASFQANAISAIHQYLERTQPPPPEEKQSRGKQTGKKRKKNKKKTAKEVSSGAQSMDM